MSERFRRTSISMCQGCVASRRSVKIEKQGWSLNPGRYVGVAAPQDDGIDFRVRLEELTGTLEKLNAEASALRSGLQLTWRSCCSDGCSSSGIRDPGSRQLGHGEG